MREYSTEPADYHLYIIKATEFSIWILEETLKFMVPASEKTVSVETKKALFVR